ncbi:MAG: allophanate hydrolase subunit 1 [Thermoanaerobaculia bacterium]|nr:allophanate hydrolase subunit 1 [Thermoanaerobaculia bacterium]
MLVRFGDPDLARAVARAHAVLSWIESQDQDQDEKLALKGEWIPGAGNLLVRLDDAGAAGGRDVEALFTRLDEGLRARSFNESLSSLSRTSGSRGTVSPTAPLPGIAEIPVVFGRAAGESGADLDAVAAECGVAADEVVRRFCAATYTVAFVGFSPGFPYLIGLPPALEVARLPAPRPAVPAGSVAIAGPFAGVYPSATPGGWRLLGRTDAPLFDPPATPPARFAAGDRVRFVTR